MRHFLLSIFFVSTLGLAQKKDALLWTGVGTDLGITKDLSIEFESQYRTNSNMSRYQQVYGEIGANHSIIRGLTGGVVYRYSRKNNGDYFYNDNRISTYLRYKYKTEFGLDLQIKMRHQYSFDRIKEINDVVPEKKHVLRTAFKLSYKNDNFKRIQPFFSTEFFYPLSYSVANAFWDTYRIRGGITLDLPKRQEVKLYYMYEHENRNIDNLNHIYCIQYNYSIKPLHKGKKKKKKEEQP